MFSKKWFDSLDEKIRDAGLDSDYQTFDEIKLNLENKKILSSFEFAKQVIYVILAGGFSQKTAKEKHSEIMNCFLNNKSNTNQVGSKSDISQLLKIFNNKNKINAIAYIWDNQNEITKSYYKLNTNNIDEKLKFLQTLPHIGHITSNHLARNLGENIVKYDIWIQRLGVIFVSDKKLLEKINNSKLNPDVKNACDKMFAHLEHETRLPRGYIDVVLWKACQIGLIEFNCKVINKVQKDRLLMNL